MVWPSRYNVPAHLNVGFVFVAYFIPAIILSNQNDYDSNTRSLYIGILFIGAVAYTAGLFIGFSPRAYRTRFYFDVAPVKIYEKYVTGITKKLLITGILMLTVGYVMMGFVPMFAADPVSAKFFRGQYQVPFYTSIVYLSAFFILSTITPISFVIWYQDKKKIFFLAGTMIAVILMMMSLSRGPAFTGLLYAVIIILSFKSKRSFTMLIILLILVYLLSSVFYYIVGVKDFADISTNFKDDHLVWRVISAGTVDIDDQLNFLTYFKQNPEWTYGRTVFGGLIPSHYKWNPAVYTLRVVNPGEDISTLVSGGLRLPVPIWGYVSFQWIGVLIFPLLSGLIKGVLLKYLKTWIFRHKDILTSTVLIVVSLSIFDSLANFYIFSFSFLPTAFILIFYMFRVKLR